MKFNEFVKRLVARPHPDGRRVMRPFTPFGPAYLMSGNQCSIRGWIQLALLVCWPVGLAWVPVEDPLRNILVFIAACTAINYLILLSMTIGLPRTQVLTVSEDQRRAAMLERSHPVGKIIKMVMVFLWICAALGPLMYFADGDWLSAALYTMFCSAFAGLLNWHLGQTRKPS